MGHLFEVIIIYVYTLHCLPLPCAGGYAGLSCSLVSGYGKLVFSKYWGGGFTSWLRNASSYEGGACGRTVGYSGWLCRSTGGAVGVAWTYRIV